MGPTRLELLPSRILTEVLKEKPLLVPVASIEDHGPLPVGADLILARCVTSRLEDYALVAPPIPYSAAEEHVERLALTASPTTFARYLREILLSAAAAAERLSVLVLVFHGGAAHAAACAVREAKVRSGGRLRAEVVNFWGLVALVVEELYGFKVDWLVHADPLEASLLAACGAHGGCGASPSEVLGEARSWPKAPPPYVTPSWTSREYPQVYERGAVPCSLELGRVVLDRVEAKLREELKRLA